MAVGWFSWATFLDLGPPGEAATSEKRVPPRNMQGTIGRETKSARRSTETVDQRAEESETASGIATTDPSLEYAPESGLFKLFPAMHLVASSCWNATCKKMLHVRRDLSNPIAMLRAVGRIARCQGIQRRGEWLIGSICQRNA